MRVPIAAWLASIAMLSGCTGAHRNAATVELQSSSRAVDADASALCGSVRELPDSKDREFRAIGKYSQSDFASFFEIGGCPAKRTYQVVDAVYTRGDASVGRLFEQIEKTCAADNRPCFVEVDMDAVVTLRDDEGHALLEFRHVNRASLRKRF